jgi:hypothetical protein
MARKNRRQRRTGGDQRHRKLDIMAAPPPSNELVRWDVPFAEWDGLSTWVIAESGDDAFTIVVAPLSALPPIENYPKYLIRFESVITLLCDEEACVLDRGYPPRLRGEKNWLRAYLWIGSPWLRSSQGWGDILGGKEFHHYLIFGDDSVIEVISPGKARIERVDAKRFIEVKHEV